MTNVVTNESGERLEAKGDGLYLRHRRGSETWLFRFQQLGRRQTVHIGSREQFTLREARDIVSNMRKAMARGDSPRAALTRPTTSRTFGEAIEDYIASAAPTWRGKNEETHTRNQLTHHWAVILRLIMSFSILKNAECHFRQVADGARR